MMQNAIQDGGGDTAILDRVPLGEGLMEGKYGRSFFVPPGNQPEEQVNRFAP